MNATEGVVSSDDYSNDLASAQAIDLNIAVTGDLEVSDDVDYFTFTLNQQTTVEFEKESRLGTVGQASAFYFTVYDSANNNLLQNYTTSLDKHSLTLNAGTYYIRTSTISNDITGYRFILNAI